jgi:uridine monophosphate synthetase
VLTILSRRSLIDEITVEKVQNFIAANQFLPANLETAAKKPKGISTLTMTYERRQDACQPQSLAKKVFALMERKKTNLCVAADVTSTKQLLSLAEQAWAYGKGWSWTP